jgi:uncharacterized membrane protein YeiH
MFTGLGGGVIRDVLLDALPPATFLDWRYLALAAGGGLIAFILSRRLERLTMAITVLDAVGLSVFAVLGADKATSVRAEIRARSARPSQSAKASQHPA